MSRTLYLCSLAWVTLAIAALYFFISNLGCQQQKTESTDLNGGETAQRILDQMVERYATASAYADQATLTLSYRLQGQDFEETHSYSTQWKRSGEFYSRWFKARIAGDAKQLVCRIIDIPTNNMDRQIVIQDIGSVGTFDPILDDAIARHFICGTTDLPWAPDVQENPNDQIPAVWSLLTDQHKPIWLRSYHAVEKLKEQPLQGKVCHRIAIDTLLGEYVAWIEQESLLLRRLEIPKGVMARELNQTEAVANIEILVDFEAATFAAGELNADLAMQVDVHEKPVRYFVTLPEKFPSDLISQQVRDFQFHALRGTDVTRQELSNKITAFLWFNGQGGEAACKAFNEVADRFVEFDDVFFFGVCADPISMANDEQVAALANYWRLNYPIVRDLAPYGERVFDVQMVPTVVVLGADGRLQYYLRVDQGSLVADTIAAIDRLKQGVDIAAEMRQQYDDYLVTYNKQIAAANPFRKSASGNTLEVKLRRQTRPARIKMEQAWTSAELVAPGNLLITVTSDGQRLFANDGWRTVVEFDLAGKTIARHPLDMPDGAAVSWLRSGNDSVGKAYFAACSMMDRQVFVFDQKWRLQGAYPQDASTENAIADVQFVDGDAAQPPRLLVAFAQDEAVHLISLQGELLAKSEPLRGTTSLAILPAERNGFEIVTASRTGRLTRLNSGLREQQPLPRSQESNFHLFGGRLQDLGGGAKKATSLLSLGEHNEFALTATVLDDQANPVGSLELEPGAFQDQVQFATFADPLADGEGQWLVARPDSTIALVSSHGNLIDSFQYGKAIKGIAAARNKDGGLLVISTPDGLEAWNIKPGNFSSAQRSLPAER